MSHEAAVLVSLCSGDADRLRTVTRGRADWDVVRRLALRHQVAGLCWALWRDRSHDLAAAGVPSSVTEAFREAASFHRDRNRHLLRELAILESALRREGVRTLYFKGPWMAWRAYPDPGARPIGDIDLGVREGDWPRTVAVLSEIGYRSAGTLPRTPAAALRRAHYGPQLRLRAKGRRDLEVHFRLVNVGPPADREDWLWDTARDLRIEGLELRVPGPEAMLLATLLHANQHGFALLRLLCDIRWTLEADGPSATDRVVDLCRTPGSRSCAYHGLVLARELAGGRPPRELVERLRPGKLARWTFRRAWRWDAVRELRGKARPRRLEAPLFYLIQLGSPADKVRYVAGIAAEAAMGAAARRTATPSRRPAEHPP